MGGILLIVRIVPKGTYCAAYSERHALFSTPFRNDLNQSSGSIVPLATLHLAQSSCRLDILLLPPRDRGSTWSMCAVWSSLQLQPLHKPRC